MTPYFRSPARDTAEASQVQEEAKGYQKPPAAGYHTFPTLTPGAMDQVKDTCIQQRAGLGEEMSNLYKK